jgi:hypothetical protein
MKNLTNDDEDFQRAGCAIFLATFVAVLILLIFFALSRGGE